MKVKNALLIPFTLVADVVTLGNMGERSFTQQLFDSDDLETRLETIRKNNRKCPICGDTWCACEEKNKIGE